MFLVERKDHLAWCCGLGLEKIKKRGRVDRNIYFIPATDGYFSKMALMFRHNGVFSMVWLHVRCCFLLSFAIISSTLIVTLSFYAYSTRELAYTNASVAMETRSILISHTGTVFCSMSMVKVIVSPNKPPTGRCRMDVVSRIKKMVGINYEFTRFLGQALSRNRVWRQEVRIKRNVGWRESGDKRRNLCMSCTDHRQDMLIKTCCCFFVREMDKKRRPGNTTAASFVKRDESRAWDPETRRSKPLRYRTFSLLSYSLRLVHIFFWPQMRIKYTLHRCLPPCDFSLRRAVYFLMHFTSYNCENELKKRNKRWEYFKYSRDDGGRRDRCGLQRR